MKTIHQLAKAGRRIERRLNKWRRKVANSATIGEATHGEEQISKWATLQMHLQNVCRSRRIGAPPVRDCTPHKKRCQLSL